MAAEALLSTQKKLSGVTTVPGTPTPPAVSGPERPLNNPTTNPNYQADLEAGRQNAVINQQLSKIAENPALAPDVKAQQMADLQKQKVALQGVPASARTDYTKIIAPMVRDYEKEQQTAKDLGGQPQDASEFWKMQLATYGKEGLKGMGLSDEQINAVSSGQLNTNTGAGGSLPIYNADTLKAAGFSDEQIASLAQVGNAANAAQQTLNANPKPTNSTLGVFQSALKAASGVGNQQLGTSDLYSKAGIATTGALGYGALAQNLAQKRAEMGQKYDSYSNLVQTVGGQMSDTYRNVLDNYKATMDTYDKAVSVIDNLNKEERDYNRQLELMQKQQDAQKEFYKFQQDNAMKEAKPIQLPNGNVMFYDSSGKVIRTVDQSGNTVVGAGYQPSPSAYAGDPTNGMGVPKGYTVIGDQVVPQGAFDKTFGVGNVGDWCGVFASTISTAKKVGNTWAEKKNAMNASGANIAAGNYTPKLGDKLLIGLGVKTDKDYGHVAVVTGFDPNTGNIYVVESNRDGRQNRGEGPGIVSAGKYNINDLANGKLGNGEWGIASGNLKSNVAQKLTGLSSLGDAYDLGKKALANIKLPWTQSGDDFKALKEMGIAGLENITGFSKVLSPMLKAAQAKQTETMTGKQALDVAGYAPTFEDSIKPYLFGNPSDPLQGAADAIIQGLKSPDSLPKKPLKGQPGYEQVMALVRTKVPDFNEANANDNFVDRSAARKDISTKYQDAIKLEESANKSFDTLVDYQNQIKNLQNGAALLNTPIINAAKALGDKSAAAYTAALAEVKGQVSQVIAGGYKPTEQQVEELDKAFSTDLTPNQLNSVIGAMRQVMSNRTTALKSLEDVPTYKVSSVIPNRDDFLSNALNQPTGVLDSLGIQAAQSVTSSSMTPDQIQYVKDNVPSGEIAVIEKASGNAGYVPQDEYDPAKYLKL